MTTAAPSLLARKAELLRGVDLGGWGPLIDDAKLDAALAGIDAAGHAAETAPPAHLIFEPLRYGGPGAFAVVVLAQDPYPTRNDAQGVCFSVPRGRAVPESLQRIFGCLDRAGLREERTGADGKPDSCGDLRTWAVQGVLMLNTALTTRVEVRGAHLALWSGFTGELVRRFCVERQAAGRRVHFLLWGGAARAVSATVRRYGHITHEWSHPSPMADNRLPPNAKFRECPHFEDVNAALAAAGGHRIVWDNLAPVVAFSDGSCPRNGAPDARAGFAAVLVGGPFRSTVVRGEVRPFAYAAADEAAPERGLAATATPATPTNNRAEYLGIIYCFSALLLGRVAGAVEVVSDSEVAVKTLLEYLPKRIAKGTGHELKNYDLVMLAWRLLVDLRSRAAAVTITHTRSHQARPPASAPARERLVHRGNQLADEHAAAATAESPTYAVALLGAPAVLAPLAAAP